MKEKKISVILPVHKIEGNYAIMLYNAVKSVENFFDDVVLMIVCPGYVKTEIDKLDLGQKLEIKYVVHTSPTDFCSQVNVGITNCETEWFSILEIDDEYHSIWLKYMTAFMSQNPDVEVLLPIIKDVNTEGKFLSFTNESTWAYGFTEKQGFLDNEILLEFQNYQISGGLYKTQVIKDNGMFKENIKLSFGYEFLLRLTHNGVKVLTVPRIGYQHVNFREDSLFWKYKNDDEMKLNEKEIKFWLEAAKKEFFFRNKRDINYVEN
jgi:Glycosyltransferase like family 2